MTSPLEMNDSTARKRALPMVHDDAKWIWSDAREIAPVNRHTWFRRSFDLEAEPASGRLEIAADSTARVLVNDTVVLRRVSRFDEPGIRTETIDVSRWLRRGTNSIRVLHHNWGAVQTFQRTTNLHAGLYISSDFVVTDDSWWWRTADEFAVTEQFLGVDGTARVRFPIDWNARAEQPLTATEVGWERAYVVTDGPWPAHPEPVEKGAQREHLHRPMGVVAAGDVTLRHPASPTESAFSAAVLTPERAARAAAEQGLAGRPVTLTAAAGEVRYITWDLHQPVHGYPVLELETHAEVVVELGYGELVTSVWDGSVLVDETGRVDVDRVIGRDYRDSIRPAAGRRRYEIPGERTARWVRLQVTFATAGVVVVHDAGLISSLYAVEPRGSFECGDERIDQIVRLALVHARVTMTDTYVDTPGREDGQWIEDARPRAVLTSRWFGDTALRRFMIRTLADGQSETGNLHPFSPSSFPWSEAPWDWSVQWVGMVWDDYLWTADTAYAAQYLPRIERFWSAVLADVDDQGVWRSSNVLGDIRTSEPPGDAESSGIVTPWLVHRLQESSRLADAVGRPDLSTLWSTAASELDATFRDRHVVRTAGVPVHVADVYGADGSHRGLSQAAQIRPLAHGMLEAAEATALIEWAFPAPNGSPPTGMSRWNNPTWSYRLLRALTVNGFGERAIAHLIERFEPYLPFSSRNTTPLALQGPLGGPLPEYWIDRADVDLPRGQVNPHQPADATGSHGWAAMPLLWLHDTLLGVSIAEPGGARIRVAPVSAGLPYLSGTTITPLGAVRVHFEPSLLRLVVEVPPGCTADLTLPLEFSHVRAGETSGLVEVIHGRALLPGGSSYTFGPVAPAWG